MLSVSAISHLAGAVAHLALTILLSLRPIPDRSARLFILGASVTMLWCVLVAWQQHLGIVPSALLWTAELLRSYIWLSFLIALLCKHQGAPSRSRITALDALQTGVRLLIATLVIYAWAEPWLAQWLPGLQTASVREFGQIPLAIIGLSLVEQLYRNTRPDRRSRIKPLGLGLGGLFAYDLYLYSDALLAGRVDPNVWAARGAVTGIIVPLISLSASRDPDWDLGLHVSRRLAFHSVTLVGSGLYLLAMGLIGHYIRNLGGAWGSVLQIIFLTAASFALVLLLLSEPTRAHVRVLLNKNFFRSAYDYREEWLSLIRTLSDGKSRLTLGERIIFAIARLVESPSGVLWVRDRQGYFACLATYGEIRGSAEPLASSDPLLTYMAERDWIVNLTDREPIPATGNDYRWPAWLSQYADAWLLVPLIRDENTLHGVLMLTKPRVSVRWDWEVLDFLKAVSRLAASYLALQDAGIQLAEASQFEGFNRLSAFVIHDLKNLIAQLTLIVRNAKRHQHNPEFMTDAFRTLNHVVERMNRMMNQLRGATPNLVPEEVDLTVMLRDVVAARSAQVPLPSLQTCETSARVIANRDRLFSSLEHLVHNAQDAAGKHGEVRIGIEPQVGEHVAIQIEDSGLGMSAEFIRDRLFKPFDTTKGLTGMGIGAYESREYIRSLGGDLVVHSELGKGTCLRILIPRGIPPIGPQQMS